MSRTLIVSQNFELTNKRSTYLFILLENRSVFILPNSELGEVKKCPKIQCHYFGHDALNLEILFFILRHNWGLAFVRVNMVEL